MDADHATTPTIAVTGGSSGLGAAVVDAIADSGRRPLVVDRRPPQREVDHVVVDLAQRRAAETAIRDHLDGGALAGLVCAAGVDECGRFEEVQPDAWERVIEVNLLGVAASIRATLPALRRGRGRVVTVASTLATRAVSDASAYCASKAGVLALSRVLAVELAPEV